MTRFIVVRHGQSTYNVEGRIQGQLDCPLSALGRLQAEAAAEYMSSMHIDAAYSSDLQRAFETCSRIAARHEGLTVKQEPALRELHCGKWQGLTGAEAAKKYPAEYAYWRSDYWNARPVDGESPQEVAGRMREIMWKIAKEHPDETVLVTSHGGAIRTLQCEWTGVPYEQITQTPWIKNAALYIIDYDVDTMKCTPVIMGEDSYLENIDITKADKEGVL